MNNGEYNERWYVNFDEWKDKKQMPEIPFFIKRVVWREGKMKFTIKNK